MGLAGCGDGGWAGEAGAARGASGTRGARGVGGVADGTAEEMEPPVDGTAGFTNRSVGRRIQLTC